MIHQDDTWTINSIYINTLEESLMKTVENYKDEIKSAMTHPGDLYWSIMILIHCLRNGQTIFI